MSSAAPEQPESAAELPPIVLPDADESSLRKCERCELSYTPAKSTSSLRLTYCSFLCELGHLGFSISGLEHMERTPPSEDNGADPEPAEDAAEPAGTAAGVDDAPGAD